MGGRGSGRDRRRRDEDYADFYNKENKWSFEAQEKSQEYLGFGNGGDTDVWYDKLTEKNVTAIERYTDAAYKKINEAIRDNDKESHWYKLGMDLKSALDKSTLSKGIVVHRGDSGKVFGVKGLSQDEKYMRMKLMEGTEMSFDNFVSTSPTKPWTGSVQYHINVPKGKGIGGYVKKYSSHHSENEFLINSGVKLKIKKVSLNKKGINEGEIDVYLTVVK